MEKVWKTYPISTDEASKTWSRHGFQGLDALAEAPPGTGTWITLPRRARRMDSINDSAVGATVSRSSSGHSQVVRSHPNSALVVDS